MATFKQISDQAIADLKLNASNREQLFDWYGRLAQRLALRAQKLQQTSSTDAAAYLAQEAAAFDLFRATKDAERNANGDPEE